MIFPETVEDIALIVNMYGVTEDEVEEWIETLACHMDAFSSYSSQFLDESHDLERHREEAQRYSDECRLLCQEISSRLGDDDTLAVEAEELALECVLAAGLAEELEAQVEELRRLVEVAEAHCDVVRTYRYLLEEYLEAGERCEDWPVQDSYMQRVGRRYNDYGSSEDSDDSD